MAAALTIAVLLAVSVSVIRIAAVAMRLTGLPEPVARFQCLSALTGTGFTTHESEMIVNYPVRRRILMALMIIGNLGLVSLAATFIVAFVGSAGETRAVIDQALAITLALAVIFVMTAFKPLDRIMCGIVGEVLMKTTTLARRRYQRTLQLEDGYCIAEHLIKGQEPLKLQDPAQQPALTFLGLRAGQSRDLRLVTPDSLANPGDVVICFGNDEAHDAFEDFMDSEERSRSRAGVS